MTVVDASVMVRLLLAEAGDDQLRERIAGGPRALHAPAHLDVEALSAICGLLRAGRIAQDRAHRMVEQYRSLRIARHAVAPLSDRVLSLRHNFTAYDAAYIALAEALREPLLTADMRLAHAPPGIHAARIETYPS